MIDVLTRKVFEKLKLKVVVKVRGEDKTSKIPGIEKISTRKETFKNFL